jgi:hypothetical protein
MISPREPVMRIGATVPVAKDECGLLIPSRPGVTLNCVSVTQERSWYSQWACCIANTSAPPNAPVVSVTLSGGLQPL